MKRLGVFTLAVVFAVLMSSHAAADEASARDVPSEQHWTDLADQLALLQQMAAEYGIEISDLRIHKKIGYGASQGQPSFGCTVSSYAFSEDGLEVQLQATAPSCQEALALLGEV